MRASTLLQTPRSRLFIWLYAAFWWFMAPVAVAEIYSDVERSGMFPPDADIEKTKVIFTVLGVLGFAPIFFGLVWFCLRRYRAASLIAWNTRRPVWSAIWTLIMGAIVTSHVSQIGHLAWLMGVNYPISFAQDFAMIYLFLVLRAAVVSQGGAVEYKSRG